MDEIKWMSIKSVVNDQVLEDEKGRSPFLKGYGSVIHRPPFRRLSDKTQVYIRPQNDHIRTRLTHSIEAQQIGRQLARIFCEHLDVREYEVDGVKRHNFCQDFEDLVSSACLAHDIGHPPFGHTGEEALEEAIGKLEEKIRNNITFESNKQNVRLLLGLGFKRPYNIPYSLIDAVMKYKDKTFSDENSDKNNKYPGYYPEEGQKIRKTLEATGLEGVRHPACYLMEAADDIAYICGDIEDSIRLEGFGQISKQQLMEKLENIPTGHAHKDWKSLIEVNGNEINHPNEITTHVMKALIHHCCCVIESLSLKDIKNTSSQFPFKLRDKIKEIQCKKERLNLLYCNNPSHDEMGKKIHELKTWLYKGNILKSSLVAKERLSAQKVVQDLFEILFCGLTKDFKKSSVARWVCDYISGTTNFLDFEKNLTFLIFTSQNQKRIKDIIQGNDKKEAKLARFVCDYISGMTDSFAISLWEQLHTPHTLKKDAS